MLDLGFDPWLEQAVMVKHLTAGVRQTSFESVKLATSGGQKPAATLRMLGDDDARRSRVSGSRRVYRRAFDQMDRQRQQSLENLNGRTAT